MGQRHLSKIYKHLVAESSGGLFKKYSVLRDVRYDEDKQHDQRYILINRKTTKEHAKMTLRSLPGCCGVAILHSFTGDPEHVAEFIKLGISACKKAGYGQLMFTLRMNSKILDLVVKTDDDSRHSFMNGKTGNVVTSVHIDLKQAPPKAKDTEGE